ncbi:MarR family winged helix-turn-helix transcriptional regulator [Ruminococcaceae bacterium OttesenSCG-928-L11]|nr:MarR family winged helix-turn-helix transcriptional regulator [Ruminococcaceae bacterium OttesenSCG-928-L11]
MSCPDSIMQPYLSLSWKATKLYQRCFLDITREYGLSQNEKDVLLFLSHNATCNTASDIAKYRSISKSLVSKSVDSLVHRGYLELHPDRHDRRCVHLHPTAEAAPLLRQLHQAQLGFFEALGEGLSREERDTLLRLMAKIGDNIAHMDDAAPSGEASPGRA